METEVEVKPLTAEDVVRIVEETLDKRESKARSKPARSESEPAIDVDALAKKIGESVAAALDQREAKRAEERAKVEAEKKAAEPKHSKASSPYDF